MSHASNFATFSRVLEPAGEWKASGEGWLALRVRSGFGYWIGNPKTINLSQGDMLVISSSWGGRLMASQVAGMELEGFVVYLAHIPSVLTPQEREQLERLAVANDCCLFFNRDDSLAMRMESLLVESNLPISLRRCRMMEVVLSALSDKLGDLSGTVLSSDARARIRDWLSLNSEFSIIHQSVEAVARDTGCSVRHFSRLFLLETGRSFREHQMDVRLRYAAELLTSTDTKIIQVALESGYQTVGLFNSLFKRRFGMTPSIWRKQKQHTSAPKWRKNSQKILGTAILCLLGSFSWVTPAAQPDSQSATPSPAAKVATNAPPLTFRVVGYEVIGNTLLSPETLDAVLKDYSGPKCTKETVQEAVQSLLLAYRGRGFSTISFEPPVKLQTNGICQIRILEGRLVAVHVVQNKWFSEGNIRRALPDLETNVIINTKLLQHELDLANSNPDRQIYPLIKTGPTVGTSELELRVKDQIPLHGRFELNNQYTPGTPELRGNASAQYNNLWQREHSIGLQYGFAMQDFKAGDNVSLLDRPLIANYSGYYRLPLSSEEPIQPQLNSNPRKFGYNEVTHQFTLPPSEGRSELTIFANRSTTDTGVKSNPVETVNPPPIGLYSHDTGQDVSTTEGVGFRVGKPLPEFWSIRSTISGGADIKNYQRASFNTNNFLEEFTFLNPSTGQETKKSIPFSSAQPTRSAHVSYLPLSVRWDGSRRDASGAFALGTGLNVNFAGGPFSDRSDFATTTGSTNSTGTYTSLQLFASREQKLPADWTLLLKADGQWANEPLISSEQFGIGGISGGRGYLEGERYGDAGWRMTIEPRTPSVDIGLVDGTMPMLLQGAFFMDYGRSYSLNPANPLHLETLFGAGFGINAKIGKIFDFRTAIAWALRETASTPSGTFRVYFAIAGQF